MVRHFCNFCKLGIFLRNLRIAQNLFVCSMLIFASTPLSAAEPHPQHKVHNTLIIQTIGGILHYARWPVSHSTPQLCITGFSSHTDEFLQSGYLPPHWNSQPLLLDSADPQIENCQGLYLGYLDDPQEQALFTRIRDLPILTISEHNRGCSIGSMFCLQIEKSSNRFQINLDSVARSGIRIHPNVLLLAKKRE